MHLPARAVGPRGAGSRSLPIAKKWCDLMRDDANLRSYGLGVSKFTKDIFERGGDLPRVFPKRADHF